MLKWKFKVDYALGDDDQYFETTVKANSLIRALDIAQNEFLTEVGAVDNLTSVSISLYEK